MKMIERTLIGLVAVFLAVFAITVWAQSKSSAALLQEGLYAEETEGNLDEAMKIYQQVIDNSASTRSTVAQAMYRLGLCHMKKQNEIRARDIFDRLISQYSDQKDIVEKVQVLLDEIGGADLAALMPVDTKVYIELGNPGRQIETILTVLADTPFANPLAMIGGQGQRRPADILGALLNPAMMAEFKKIKGSAIAVTGFSNNSPQIIAVLYPGKSDALRGILLAGLGMAGKSAEQVEGMNAFSIQGDAGAVYDDRVIIFAMPASQLQSVVSRYKGITAEPSLASNNKSFAKLGKKQRQNNAMTVWGKVDEIYNTVIKIFPEGKVPMQLTMANAFLDLSNIEDYIETTSIEQDGLYWKAAINFKQGHNCLAYDMIRTPNINKNALQSVPADAVAVFSFALSDSDEKQADTIRAKVKNVTGLDIGREIFSNIEQVTLFAIPAKQTDSALPLNIGLSLTSGNPVQTRQILGRILGTVSTRFGGSPANIVDMSVSRYQVGMFNNNPIYCHIEQTDKSTILSIGPDTAKAAAAAIKGGNNITNAGTLAEYVNKLSSNSSKMVLINAGGAIRLAAPFIIQPFEQPQQEQLAKNFEQLALAADNTTIEIRTQEKLNEFSIESNIIGMPRINEVAAQIGEISSIMKKAKAQIKAKQLRQAAGAVIYPAAEPVVIDGIEDDVWAAAPRYKLTNYLYSPVSSADDLSASFKAMWDENYLYVLVDVTDDVLMRDSTPDNWYQDDSVEIYIDADNTKSDKYGPKDGQYYFHWDKTQPTKGTYRHGNASNVEFAMIATDKGYRTEIKFPWTDLGVKPQAGMKMGLDVHVNDDDIGGERDTKLMWNDKRDTAWDNPQSFGNASLAGLVGWWKLDETEGTIAKDSSGQNRNGNVIANAKWVKGKIGNAIELDGKTAYIEIADSKDYFNFADEVSIICWVNVRSTANQWAGIVTKGDSSWRLSMNDYNRMFHCSVTEWDQFVVDGRVEVPANQWQHIAAVYDGKKMCLYVNGEIDTCKNYDRSIRRNDFDVLIGENAQQTGRFFGGMIDDVRIYNHALTADKVKELYQAK